METNRFYPYLVWLATLLIAPLLLAIIEFLLAIVISFSFSYNEMISDLTIVPIFWLFSFVLSLPLFMIYCIVFYGLRGKVTTSKLRLVLNTICVIGICATFIIMKGPVVFFAIAYSISTVIASFLFRIMKKEKVSNSDAMENP